MGGTPFVSVPAAPLLALVVTAPDSGYRVRHSSRLAKWAEIVRTSDGKNFRCVFSGLERGSRFEVLTWGLYRLGRTGWVGELVSQVSEARPGAPGDRRGSDGRTGKTTADLSTWCARSRGQWLAGGCGLPLMPQKRGMNGAPGDRSAAEGVKSNRGSFDSLRSLKRTVVGWGVWSPTHVARYADAWMGHPIPWL